MGQVVTRANPLPSQKSFTKAERAVHGIEKAIAGVSPRSGPPVAEQVGIHDDQALALPQSSPSDQVGDEDPRRLAIQGHPPRVDRREVCGGSKTLDDVAASAECSAQVATGEADDRHGLGRTAELIAEELGQRPVRVRDRRILWQQALFAETVAWSQRHGSA